MNIIKKLENYRNIKNAKKSTEISVFLKYLNKIDKCNIEEYHNLTIRFLDNINLLVELEKLKNQNKKIYLLNEKDQKELIIASEKIFSLYNQSGYSKYVKESNISKINNPFSDIFNYDPFFKNIIIFLIHNNLSEKVFQELNNDVSLFDVYTEYLNKVDNFKENYSKIKNEFLKLFSLEEVKDIKYLSIFDNSVKLINLMLDNLNNNEINEFINSNKDLFLILFTKSCYGNDHSKYFYILEENNFNYIHVLEEESEIEIDENTYKYELIKNINNEHIKKLCEHFYNIEQNLKIKKELFNEINVSCNKNKRKM